MDEKKKNMLRALGFKRQIDRVERGDCPFCGDHVDPESLGDDRSRKEFEISGMCQQCQDRQFAPVGD